MNVVKLALDTALVAYNSAKHWISMEWFLREAEFYLIFTMKEFAHIPVEFRPSAILCSNLYSLLLLVWMHGNSVTDDQGLLRFASELATVELSNKQSAFIASFSFNIGLDHVKKGDYEGAVNWLKMSYRLCKY